MPTRPGAVATQPARTAARPPARPAAAFTVQVGAYARRADADAKHRQMSAQGHGTRVVMVGDLWRVRMGRYASRDAAASVARSLKAKRIEAFVTEAESP
jgi:cell division protein FtsN